MANTAHLRHFLLISLFTHGALVLAQQDGDPLVLEVSGRISDGHKKLANCTVVVYEGNEILGEQVSGKNGHFGFAVTVGKQYAVLFKKEGYQSKSILVDTHAKLPVGLNAVAPLDMDLSLQALSKYEGVDTDVLDFPYAIVKWDKSALAFVQDVQYTSGMMRTTGALLLQSGRAVKP